MSSDTLPRIGSIIEHAGAQYVVTSHATHNLDTLGGLVMGRKVIDVNTMQTAKRATRIHL